MKKGRTESNNNASELFNFTKDSYLERTSRPIYALVFLLPFVIFYELGTIFINTDVLSQSQIRVVAFVWLQRSLEYAGFGSRFAWMAPAITVIVILIALQLASKKGWGFCISDIWVMAIECIVLAVPLIVLSLFLNSTAGAQQSAVSFNGGSMSVCGRAVECFSTAAQETDFAVAESSLLADIVTSIGAGIYEELVFRLILISLLVMVFQDCFKIDQKNSILLSVFISAALFSAHHHIDFLSGQLNVTESFSLARFGFRTIAGVYFAVLFAIRGFGITAGTHAFYDIMAVFIKLLFFDH